MNINLSHYHCEYKDYYKSQSQLIRVITEHWLNDVLLAVSDIKSDIFRPEDIYKYTGLLKKYHPLNNNIEAKIRQQLQILRDNNILEFLERGVYKKL